MSVCHSKRAVAVGILGCFLAMRTWAAVEPVDGTTGIPMGGVGAGAVKFCPHLGTFAATAVTPVANTNFSKLEDTCFQFYSRRGTTVITNNQLTSVLKDGHYDDDAFFPVEYANFGAINGVDVHLTAFSPFDLSSLDRMSQPQSFFSINVTNTEATEVSVALALQLGTKVTPIGVLKKGMRTSGEIEYAVYAASSDPTAIISYGNDPGFATDGQCSNSPVGSVNKTAVKLSLAPHETKSIKFVLAWFNGVQGKPYSEDRYHYVTDGASAGEFADLGLANFDGLMKNAVEIANRMRASNLPEWLKNQTMNTLCNLSNNWVYTKDGRMACAEGQWPYMGTMDQMWHARQIYTMLNPEMVWDELHYWARTQKTSPEGQMHHDFCLPDAGNQSLVPWDDQQHKDYREIDNWVDLNCGFIISFYEAFIATDDRKELAWFWPYLKRTGQRILTQSEKFPMAKYPGTFSDSGGTYDAGGNSDAYNSGLALVAYNIMSQLSALQGDASLQVTYDHALQTAKQSFQARWLDPRINNFPYGRVTENVLAGQQMGYFLKFEPFFPQANLDYGLSVLTECYAPITGLHHPDGTYDEWAEYILAHMGDLLIQTGHMQEWRSLQNDYYQRCYLDRDITFDTELGIPRLLPKPNYPAASFGGAGQYISNPALWRNYYDIVGFHRNKVTGELWIEPHLPDELNHVLTDGLFLSPEGMGTISTVESGGAHQNQSLSIRTDSPMTVTKLYVKDLYGDKVDFVTVEGKKQTFNRIGAAYGKRLAINWAGTISTGGIKVEVRGDPAFSPRGISSAFNMISAKNNDGHEQGLSKDVDDNGEKGMELSGPDSWIAFNDIDFGTGADSLQARMSGAANSTLEAHLDSPTGTLMGGLKMTSGGWQTSACVINGASGLHKLYLVAAKDSKEPVSLNWLQFYRRVHPGESHEVGDQIEAEAYDVMSGNLGVFSCADPTDSKTTTNITDGGYLGFQEIDFGKGVNLFNARAASDTTGGSIEIHLDDLTGPLLAACPIANTGGWDNWKTFSCALPAEKTVGRHRVYLVFKGSAGYLFNLNWFQFLQQK